MSQALMPLAAAKELALGQRVVMLVSTMGCDVEDVERVHPVGATAVVETVETLPAPQGFAVHVVIGEGDRAIVNVFDEGDYDGLFPFALAA